MKRISSVWIALLGIIIGLLVANLLSSLKERSGSPEAAISKLDLILSTAQQNYVDTIDFDKVTDQAAFALLQAMDPHSTYIPKSEMQDVEDDLEGNFEGIGIQFNVPNDTAVVLDVIAGGPSEKIGLLQGDRILKVDDKVIAGVQCPQDSMVRRMKGPAGTKVTVTVKRGGETIPFEITRGKIPTHCVDAAFMLQDGRGYIRLSKFSRTTALEVYDAINSLKEQGMTKLLFDVRDNSGGYMDQAVTLSNFFLEDGKTIVSLKGLHRKEEVYSSDEHTPFKDLDMLVLINENSASSSEIFAGAMQGNGRAKLVGRRSFGKGLVQEPFYFSDNSGFRLTIARFYTPDGKCIQKPYTDDYIYEVYKRYDTGEMTCRDSIKADSGGIVPDIFVPVDTTKVGTFYVACNKKATAMRFASAFFDNHKEKLGNIDNYATLLSYLDSSSLESEFLSFAKRKDGIAPSPAEWTKVKSYMMTQIRALVGRYSKLGDNAFYHLYLDIDETVKEALKY